MIVAIFDKAYIYYLLRLLARRYNLNVYSWKTLFVSILGCGFFIYKIFHFEGFGDLIFLGFFFFLLVKGFYVSFSKDGFDDETEKSNQIKNFYRKIFGRFAPIAPYFHLILMFLTCIVAIILPTWKWLILSLLMLAIIYAIWIFILYKKHMIKEKQQEKINDDKHK